MKQATPKLRPGWWVHLTFHHTDDTKEAVTGPYTKEDAEACLHAHASHGIEGYIEEVKANGK